MHGGIWVVLFAHKSDFIGSLSLGIGKGSKMPDMSPWRLLNRQYRFSISNFDITNFCRREIDAF